MGVYDRQTALAQRLIAAKGQLVIWRKTQAVTDPDKPWNKTPGAATDTSIRIAFVTGSDFMKLLAGSNLAGGGQRAIMGRAPFTPEISDVVIRDEVTYAINTITPVAPNGEIILYKIEFKK